MKKITANYITGFIDGEGCFTLHIFKTPKSQFGYCFTPSFSVSQNTESVRVLEEIQVFFGCGFIRKDRKTSKYEVRSLSNLHNIIIPFFKKNRLRTAKKRDFEIFCEICNILESGEHLNTVYSRIKLVELAYLMNKNGVNRRKDKASIIQNLLMFDKVKV